MSLWAVGTVLWDAGLVPKQHKEGSMGCRAGPKRWSHGMQGWSQWMLLWVVRAVPKDGPVGHRVDPKGWSYGVESWC